MKNVFMPTMASLAALFVSCSVNAQTDVFGRIGNVKLKGALGARLQGNV